VAVLWSVCAVLAIVFRPVWIAGAAFLPRCPWHAFTGWPCPGCGTTRAIVHLFHADPVGALAHNPLAASGAMAFIAGGLVAPLWLACGGRAPVIAAPHAPRWRAAAALIVVANWAWLAFAGV